MTLKKFILIASLIELIIIAVLAANVYKNKDNVLGTKDSVNPIDKGDLIFPEEGDLEYFYEPKPNNIESKKQDWLPNGYEYTITINADSLSERFDYSADKPQDVFRIITLGDSFTYGLYVNTKDNYPEQLEDLLNSSLPCRNIKKFEVINLGMGGYDIQYAAERFKKRGLKYNPDLILWLLKNDDLDQIMEKISAKSNEYKRQMEESGELKEYEEKGIFYPYVVKATQELGETYRKEQILDYQYAAMKSLRTIYNDPLVFLSSPFGLTNEFKDVIEKFVRENSHSYYYSQLPNLVGADSALPDGHPNKAGYTLYVNNIFH